MVQARDIQRWRSQVLSTTSIETADEHGTPVAIEPGLNAVAHMGRSIVPSILVMWNADFLPLDILKTRKGTGSLVYSLDVYDAKDVRAETAAGAKIDEGNAHHTL